MSLTSGAQAPEFWYRNAGLKARSTVSGLSRERRRGEGLVGKALSGSLLRFAPPKGKSNT